MNPSDPRSQDCSRKLAELLEFACFPEFAEEMIVARELFMLLSGKVNDDDVSYEQRMLCFQEFFLFEHRLSAPHTGMTLLELFLQRSQSRLPKDELTPFEQMRSAGRSLVILERVHQTSVHVRDLLGRRVVHVHALPGVSLKDLPPGQVFEARLVSYFGRYFFTGSFIFHPSTVTPLIERLVRAFLDGEAHVILSSPKEALSLGTQAPALGSEPQKNNWKAFLNERFKTLQKLHTKREAVEADGRKRAVDHLTLSRSLTDVYRMVSAPDRVTVLDGQETTVDSCFIPEGPVVPRTALLHILAQCEIRCLRYRHIEPTRVYGQSLTKEGGLLVIQRPERQDDLESQQALRALA
jgi:hypothetical protein